MNIVDKAWEIVKKVNPQLALESFLETLRPVFDRHSHLSKNEIFTKMLEYIKNEKPFGEKIAQAAEIALEKRVSQEEASKNIESYALEEEESDERETTKQIEQPQSL
ncbi:hypothetical protein F7734_10535 [Scytonema sp. UIC 10036]|uniref:hypothetical protein n=1 Tax=Scytonema sp. UIC 10036 TaxID=2304196 RepID=UPI0012DA707F|nr:hypothetical protein [Scytonema sp. UIC 10036]MUG92862.1 hypothetical protein [Scytonema sp. UIC 10036]